jgi:hypothetical protein
MTAKMTSVSRTKIRTSSSPSGNELLMSRIRGRDRARMDTADSLRARRVLSGSAFSLISRAVGIAGRRRRILTRGRRGAPAALTSDKLSLPSALYRPQRASAW